ncbi:MAG: hypothetical protein IKL32_03410 [Alphaproteobacteria bacterium]|nr:hypothetical protein [Alphaproteobacteria bacterium]
MLKSIAILLGLMLTYSISVQASNSVAGTQTSKENASTQETADNQKVKIQGKIRILQQK